MKWFILLVGIVVLCGVAALVLGYVGGGMGRATSTLSHQALPDDELTDSDLEQLRFDVGLRGYRMSEVDSVIGRLRRELKDKDEQLAVLRGEAPPVARGVEVAGPAVAGPAADQSDAARVEEGEGPADDHGDAAAVAGRPAEAGPPERREAPSAE